MIQRLLGTTALAGAAIFAVSSTAAAQTKVQPIQVSVGGYWGEYISYTNQDNVGSTTVNGVPGVTDGKITKFDEWSDKEIHFNGRTTLDNGLTIGFRLELEGNTDATDQIDETYMFIEGRFGRIELGSINNVQYRMGYNAPEAQTRPWSNEGNIFNVFLNNTGSPSFDTMIGTTRSRFFDNDSEKVNYYTPRFEGFQFGASYIPNSSQDRETPESVSSAYSRGYAFGANFVRTFGAFDVAASAGYMAWQGPQLTATTSAPDPDQWNVGLQLGYAGFKVGGSYGKLTGGRSGAAGLNSVASTAGTGANRAQGRAWDAGVMYTFGPAAVSVDYINGTNNDSLAAGPDAGTDKFSMVSLAGKYTLGPGVSLEAVVWTAKLQSNAVSPVPNEDNKGTGGVVGVVLVF